MKTTLEIPDAVFRKAKAKAAEQGIPLRQFVTEAVEEKLKTACRRASLGCRWREALRHLKKENARIDRIIEEEFGRIEPEDWK